MPFLLAFWTGGAVCYSVINDSMAKTIIILLLYLFYKSFLLKRGERTARLNKPELFVALFFACGLEMMKYPHYIFTILGSKKQFLKSCISAAGYWALAAALVELLLDWLYRCSARKSTNGTQAAYRPENVQKWMSAAVFVIGIPYLYAFYPGGVFSDMFVQISSYYTKVTSNYFPVLTTYLNGFVVKMGSNISDNFGVFLANLVQYLLFCATVGYVMRMLYQLTGNRKAVLLCLLFYTLVPAFYHFSYLLTKVSIYSPLFALYCCLIIKFLLETRLSKREWVLFAALNILLLLIRKEGVYVVLISAVVLLFAFLRDPKARKQFLWLLALILCAHVGYHQVFLKAFHISEGPASAALNIPFLQTSLYIREAYDDITEEECRVLQEIFGDDLQKVGECYDPTITDPVMAQIKAEPDRETYMHYFSAYVRMGLRHPNIYAQALLEHISAYIFPEGYRSWYTYQDMDTLEDRYKSPYLDVYSNPAPAAVSMRQFYHRCVNAWEKIPVLSLLMAPGTYIWIYLLLFALLFRIPDKKYLAAFIPLLCVLGICCLSPVNGYTRYFIPLEMTLPIYIGYTLKLYAMHIKPSRSTDESPILT